MTAPTSSTPPRRRRGFTLVELLVAMALIVFIMVILTEAFTAGIGTFRNLKAQGDMQERLRASSTLLRDDLIQAHFDQSQKLSNITASGSTQINGGYFFIQQSPSAGEGADAYGIPSLRMNAAANAALCFTVRRTGIQPQDYFAGRVPDAPGPNPALPQMTMAEQSLIGAGPIDYRQGSALISQWAEVGYFLVPTGDTAGGTPLFTLRRRQRVVLDNQTIAASLNTGNNNRVPVMTTVGANNTPVNLLNARYAEVSCVADTANANPNWIHFNTPSDLVNQGQQAMRLSLTPLAAGGQGQADWFGDDIVTTDVLSFNVRALFPGQADFIDLPPSPNSAAGTSGTYNTAGANPPQQVSALEITLRVWDVKTQLTRQITIVQDM